SIRDLSSEYGVSEVTIYKWIKDFTPVDESDKESLTSKEVAEIQKENLKLKQELEILKKAMAIFAKKINATVLTNFIDQKKDNYPIQTMCDVLDLLRRSEEYTYELL